jgi:hypothetical protein
VLEKRGYIDFQKLRSAIATGSEFRVFVISQRREARKERQEKAAPVLWYAENCAVLGGVGKIGG